MRTFQILILNGPNGIIQTPIESFSYQFGRQSFQTIHAESGKIREFVPLNSPVGGVFSIVKMTNDVSRRIMNALTDVNQEFSLARIEIRTDGSSLILNFFNVLPSSLSNSRGRDTITFSYETTNIPRIPDKDMFLWKHANGGISK